MRIKDANGNEVNVTSQGQGTFNTVGAAMGIAGALGALGFGTGMFGNRNQQPQSDGDRPVTRFEMGLMMETMKKEVEIAEMKAEMSANSKMTDMEKKQMEFNATQMAYNATANGMMTGLQAQINQMRELAKMVIPSSNVVDITATATQSATTQQAGR